jgi:hypothetical protein
VKHDAGSAQQCGNIAFGQAGYVVFHPNGTRYFIEEDSTYAIYIPDVV